MSEERFSDLAVIAMHYSERFEVDETCQAFVKARPRRLFQASIVCLIKLTGKKETNNYHCCPLLLVLNNSALNSCEIKMKKIYILKQKPNGNNPTPPSSPSLTHSLGSGAFALRLNCNPSLRSARLGLGEGTEAVFRLVCVELSYIQPPLWKNPGFAHAAHPQYTTNIQW